METNSTEAILETLHKTLDIPSNLSGFEYLKRLCQNIWESFQFDYIVVGYAENAHETTVKTLVCMADGQLTHNFRYELEGTPCQHVFQGSRICFYPDHIVERFPKDKMLKEMGAESYIGAPTIFEGRIAGLLAVLNRTETPENPALTQIMEFLAARIAIELERYDLSRVIQSAVDAETEQIRQQNAELRRQTQEDPLTGTYTPRTFFGRNPKLVGYGVGQ